MTSGISSSSSTTKTVLQIPYDDVNHNVGSDRWSFPQLQQRIAKLLQVNNSKTNEPTMLPKGGCNNLHKVCLAIAGGGGTALSTITATSGASQFLLEGTVTYDRSSYQTFVRKNSSTLSRSDSSNISTASNSGSSSSSSSSKKRFSYTSMEAARLASMSALWRGMELQMVNNNGQEKMKTLQSVIGMGVASTLQTNTIGAKSRSGRPSFGNLVATRGDGHQISMRFTLNHHQRIQQQDDENDDDDDDDDVDKKSSSSTNNARFDQDVMVSHLMVQCLEQFIVGEPKWMEFANNNNAYTTVDIDPTDFPGVTVEQWTTNILLDEKNGSNLDRQSKEECSEPIPDNPSDTVDPVEMSARRILSGEVQAVLLLPKDHTTTENETTADIVDDSYFLHPIVYPVLPDDCLIFPGSFNPPHIGHLALAQAAISAVQAKWQNDATDTSSTAKKQPFVVFELSIVNADKPSMEPTEVARRVALFRDVLIWNNTINEHPPPLSADWGILLTSAPLFADKVRVLREAAPPNKLPPSPTFSQHQLDETNINRWSFIIGTDTMVRILNPKYYNNDPQQMLQCLRNMDVGFVVGGRLDQSQDGGKTKFVTGESELQDLPSDIQHMFLLLDESEFRVDVSSTELRRKAQGSKTPSDDDDNDDIGNDSAPSSKKGGKSNTGMGSTMLNIITASLALLTATTPYLGLPACQALTPSINFGVLSHPHQANLWTETPQGLFQNYWDSSSLQFRRELDEEKQRQNEEIDENLVSVDSVASTAAVASTPDEVCTPIEKCQQCTFNEQKMYEACKDTGRWVKYECVIPSAESDRDTSSRDEMRSCKYSEADEEFAMVRLQMLCFLIGSMAIVSVRRQKRLSASLFDQRKQGPVIEQNGPSVPIKKNSNFVSANDQEIEFTLMTNREQQQQQQLQRERVPLIDGGSEEDEDDLEVV